jgi:midasin
LLVLLVVDSTNPTQSILTLKSVTYPNGKLKVEEYLDNFPFPYYIILRDIKAMPEIVSDALRQWFELIQRAT